MIARDPVLVVLQARLGSTRLPGKVLSPIGGQPLLAHCIRRLCAAGVGPVVVATTTNPEDDAVCRAAHRFRAHVFRGPAEDVLERFRGAIAGWGGQWIIRATADNPAVDPASARRVADAVRQGADYAVELGLPVGATVEGMRTDVLVTAAGEADTLYDREHVTPFIRQRPERFVLRDLAAPPAERRHDLRFTVDTPADLRYMRALLERARAADRIPSLAELIDLADGLARHSRPA